VRHHGSRKSGDILNKRALELENSGRMPCVKDLDEIGHLLDERCLWFSGDDASYGSAAIIIILAMVCRDINALIAYFTLSWGPYRASMTHETNQDE